MLGVDTRLPRRGSRGSTGALGLKPALVCKVLKQFGCPQVEIECDSTSGGQKRTETAIQCSSLTHPDLFEQLVELGYRTQNDGQDIFIRHGSGPDKKRQEDAFRALAAGKSINDQRVEPDIMYAPNKKTVCKQQQQNFVSRLAVPKKRNEEDDDQDDIIQPVVVQSTVEHVQQVCSRLAKPRIRFPRKLDRDLGAVDSTVDNDFDAQFTAKTKTRTYKQQQEYIKKLSVPSKQPQDADETPCDAPRAILKADKSSSNDSSKAKINESPHVSQSKPVADLEHANENVAQVVPEPDTQKTVTLKVEKTVSRRKKSKFKTIISGIARSENSN